MFDRPSSSAPSLDANTSRFYYGYVMAGVSMVGLLATAPGQTFIVSVFNTAIADSLKISLAQLSTAYMIGTLLASLPLTWVGRLSDRFGTRMTMGVVALLFGLACMLIGNATGIVTLTIGFFFLRFLGQGSLGLISGHVMAMWFERKLGRLDGMRHATFSATAAVLPIPVFLLVRELGWGNAYAVLGLCVWVMVLPLVLTVFRNRPEDMGQLLDGDAHPASEEATDDELETDRAATVAVIERDNDAMDATAWPDEDKMLATAPLPPAAPAFTLNEAKRTLAFWTLALSGVSLAMIGTGIIFHVQPMALDIGLTEWHGAWLVSTWAVNAMFATLLAGYLIDWFAPRRIVALGLVALALSPLMLVAAGTFALAVIALTLLGIGHGMLVSGTAPTLARYFGRAHHGAIRGFTSTLGVAATSVGPVILGVSRDYLHSYVPALVLCTAICVPLVAAALLLKPPPTQDVSEMRTTRSA